MEDYDSDELFEMSESEREELLKVSTEIYIQQVEMGALLVEVDFLSFLKDNLIHTETQIEKYQQEEKYEICYFLQEIINRIKLKYDVL